MTTLLLLGSAHPLTLTLAAAIDDADTLGEALAELDLLPRRRLLATLANVLS